MNAFQSTYQMKIGPKGKISFVGVDMGPVVLHYRNGDLIVAKKTGHKYWGGIGQLQHYSPAEFQVYRVIEYREDGYYEVERLVHFPIKGEAF